MPAQPIRSPRQLYKLTQVTEEVKEGLDGSVTTSPASRPLIVLMKESIGIWLSLNPLPYNDPDLTGTFGGEGSNKDAKFRRRVGGYRVASYTLIAKTTFAIGELIKGQNGTYTTVNRNFETISIGFPKGHSVNEFINFIGATNRIGEIAAIRTPNGRKIPLAPAAAIAPAPANPQG